MHATTDQLIALRDGEPTAAGVSDHVRACRQCRKELARLTATRDALRSLAEPAMPTDGWKRLEHALARPQRRSFPLFRKWPALVAGLAAMLLVVVWFLPGGDHTETTTIGDASAPAIDSLAGHARFLQATREAIGSQDLPLDYATAATLDELEAGIRLIDTALDSDPPEETRYQLWSRQVDLLEAIVAIELAEAGWAARPLLVASSQEIAR